jgi:hypothetical protein
MKTFFSRHRMKNSCKTRGGSGLKFLGLGCAQVLAFGHGLFWPFTLKIALEAFKFWVLITDL